MHRKHLCSTCGTGAVSLALDRDSVMCPYLECITDGKCPFYTPVEEKNEVVKTPETINRTETKK